jgi:hypothetical protein
MDDNQKLQFWKVKWQSDDRRKQVIIISVMGALLLLVQLSALPNLIWIVLATVVAVSLAGSASVYVDHKPPEPKLELIDEKYKVKASGVDGINALALIVAFKEQEHLRSERLLMFIGSGFGVIAIVIGLFSDNLLPVLTSSLFAIQFVAWASKVRSVRVKGFGIEVASGQGNKKATK